MKKLSMMLVMAFAVIQWFPVLAVPSYDASVPQIASGVEGDNIFWTFFSDGTLELNGVGGTIDYNKYGETSPTISDRPWNSYKNNITKLIIGEGVTHIGSRAFQGYAYLECVVFSDTVVSVGEWAFQNCTKLDSVIMLEGVRIGNGAFRNTPAEYDVAATEVATYVGSVYYERLVQTDLTGDFRNDVIAIAHTQIGYHEGDGEADYGGGNTSGTGDYSEYGRYMGSAGTAWCSEFASWCIRMSGMPFQLVNSSNGANANAFTSGTSAKYYSWQETIWGGGVYVPKKGDLILWVWSGFTGEYRYDSSLSHTTILENYTIMEGNVSFSVVHGNYGNKVESREFIVNKSDGRLKNGNGYIGYFVAPDYENKEINRCVVSFDPNG